MRAILLFLGVALSGCAGYPNLPAAQARAISDYHSAQSWCASDSARRHGLLVTDYINCMRDLGYVEPYPGSEEK